MRWLVAASTVYFSTEICLRFNLGPLLAGLIEDVIKQHGKDFFRKAPPSQCFKPRHDILQEESYHVPTKIFE